MASQWAAGIMPNAAECASLVHVSAINQDIKIPD